MHITGNIGFRALRIVIIQYLASIHQIFDEAKPDRLVYQVGQSLVTQLCDVSL